LSEEQVIEIFGSCGKVLNFRLVYDRETGRPKGFGFIEYPDSGTISSWQTQTPITNLTRMTDAASSAVRNLNDHEIMGRKLRVDYSNDNAEDDSTMVRLSVCSLLHLC